MKASADGMPRVVLDGDLDLSRKSEIAALLPNPKKVDGAVIDCTNASYIDSMVLGMLVQFRREFVNAGGDAVRVALVLPKEGPVRRAFEITGLARLFAHAADATAPGSPSRS